MTIELTPNIYDANNVNPVTVVENLNIDVNNLPGVNELLPYESRIEFIGRNGGLTMDADIDNIRVLYKNECLKCSAPEYADWVMWGKPCCWCCARQCRGDADCIKSGPFRVAIPDLNIFRLYFNKIEALVPECDKTNYNYWESP